MWSDHNHGTFPVQLGITTMNPINLTGIKLISNPAGWPTHYAVQGQSSSNSWEMLAELRDVPDYSSRAMFNQSYISSSFCIFVYNVTTSNPDVSINEVYPIYANDTMSTPNSKSAPSSSACSLSSSKSSQVPSEPSSVDDGNSQNGLVGIIIAAVGASCVVLTIIAAVFFRVRRRSRRGHPLPWDRIKDRRKPPIKKDTISNRSTEGQGTEIDTGLIPVRRELGNSSAVGVELAESNIPITELSNGVSDAVEGRTKLFSRRAERLEEAGDWGFSFLCSTDQGVARPSADK